MTIEKTYHIEEIDGYSDVSYSHMDSEKGLSFDIEEKSWRAYFPGPGLTSRPATIEEVRKWFKRWAQ